MSGTMRKTSRYSVAVGLLVLLWALAVTATTAYSAHNANIRGPDGKLTATRLTTDPQHGALTMDDGTGIVTANASTATVLKGSPMAAGTIRGSVVVSATDGTIELKESGLYEVRYCAGDGAGTNSYTNTFSIFKQIGAGSNLVLSPAIQSAAVSLTAQGWIPQCAYGYVAIQPDEAASGVFLSLTAKTSSAGPITTKRIQFAATKVDELDPPAP